MDFDSSNLDKYILMGFGIVLAIIGVLNAVKELGMEGQIVVIGYDSGTIQQQAIRDGVMAGAVQQNPVGIGAVGHLVANTPHVVTCGFRVDYPVQQFAADPVEQFHVQRHLTRTGGVTVLPARRLEIRRGDLERFHTRYYVAANAVVAIVHSC